MCFQGSLLDMSTNPVPNSFNTSDSASLFLTPIEAAHFLGITQELLFAYARTPAKGSKWSWKDTRVLPRSDKHGQIVFLKRDLQDFDDYLRTPWAEKGTRRADIPAFIENHLKIESGGQCARCGRGNNLESAHIVAWAETQSNYHGNLIRLCSDCHGKFDTRPVPLVTADEIWVLKSRLVVEVQERLLRTVNNGPSSSLRIPNPAFPFVGREDDITFLADALREKHSVSIRGVGGIGKTQLVLHTLHQTPDERPIFWVSIEAFQSVPDVEMALCAAFSTPGNLIRTSALTDALAHANVRLVFDGIEQMSPTNMDPLEDFFQSLLTMTTIPQLIFISQVELNNLVIDAPIHVQSLRSEYGLSIVNSALLPDWPPASEKDLRWLVSFCQGHPLTLNIVTGLLRHFKSASVVADLIHNKGAVILESPTRRKHNTSTSLRACLLVSLQTLTKEQRQVLWLAAMCPAGCTTAHLETPDAYGFADIEEDIAALRHWHLVDVEHDVFDQRRLHVLSPVRAIVVQEWEAEEPKDAGRLRYELVTSLTIQALVINHMHLRGGATTLGVERFSQESSNFIQALQLAVAQSRTDERYLQLVGSLASAFLEHCFIQGDFQRGIQIMRAGAEAFAELGQKIAASDLLLQMLTLGKRSKNLEVMQEAAEYLVQLAQQSDEPRVHGNAESAQGAITLDLRQLQEAAQHFADAAKHYKQAIDNTNTLDSLSAEDKSENSFFGHDNSALGSFALALQQQGFVQEAARRPDRALLFYEQALSIVLEINDEINLGSILHQIGNCAADVEQMERSQEAYASAAKQFHSIHMAEYLSNSLSELGYLLIKWDPSTSLNSLIPEEVLSAGLNDITMQIKSVFIGLIPTSDLKAELETIRKAFGMVALLSFSSSNVLLAEWADELREDVLRPIFKGTDQSKPALDLIPLMYIDLISALAGSLSSTEQPNGIGPVPPLDYVAYMASLCYKFWDWGWQALHAFEWLSTYLRRHRGLQEITPGELRRMAKDEMAKDEED